MLIAPGVFTAGAQNAPGARFYVWLNSQHLFGLVDQDAVDANTMKCLGDRESIPGPSAVVVLGGGIGEDYGGTAMAGNATVVPQKGFGREWIAGLVEASDRLLNLLALMGLATAAARG